MTIDEQHAAFMEKLREFLDQNMPESWNAAFMILIPDPSVTEKDTHHVFWHTDMDETKHKWAIYEWALRLHDGTVEVDDLRRRNDLQPRSGRK